MEFNESTGHRFYVQFFVMLEPLIVCLLSSKTLAAVFCSRRWKQKRTNVFNKKHIRFIVEIKNIM